MNRILPFFIASAVLFASCQSSPQATSQISVTKYGSGNVETGKTASSSKVDPQVEREKAKNDELAAKFAATQGEFDTALSETRFRDAIASFESIVSLSSSVPAGVTKANADRDLLLKALDAIVFETASVPGETVAGTPFKKDFSAKVSLRSGDDSRPFVGLACVISYPSVSPTGERSTVTEKALSADDGTIALTAPTPAHSVRGALSIAIDLSSSDESLRNAIAERIADGRLSASFKYAVSTNAKRQATTIAILDFNKDGKPLSFNASATILLKPLVQKGFSPIGMADFPRQLASGDEEALIKAAKDQFGSAVKRFVFGTVRITDEAQNDDGSWSCSATAKVGIYDFSMGEMVYRTEVTVAETAKTAAAAEDVMRKKLAGELLVQEILYNF